MSLEQGLCGCACHYRGNAHTNPCDQCSAWHGTHPTEPVLEPGQVPWNEHPLEQRDRLSRVQERHTYVLLLFVRGTDPDNDIPGDILGPFTRVECERVEQNLACAYRREQINTQVPTWADARIGRG